jgi:hypothetical protein
MTNHSRKLIGLMVLLPLLLVNCSLDDYSTDDLPNWTSTLELPLLSASINLASLLDDSLIHTIPTIDGDSLYAYMDTLAMEEVLVGDELRLDPMLEDYTHYASDIAMTVGDTSSITYDLVGLADISEQIIAEVGLIEMDNIEPLISDPVPFRAIMPEALIDNLEAMLADSGGSAHVVIDPVELLPVQSEFAFNSFNEMVLASGFMDLTITNEMFIYLGLPLTVTMLDTFGVELFSIPWSEEIAPGAESTESVDMSGRTIPGNVLLQLSGTSNGTHGDPVLIDESDLDSGFILGMAARDFLAESVWAQIPSQSLEGSDQILLENSDTRIENALLGSCNLTIDLTNGMELTGDLVITIPDLISPAGDPWEVTLPLPTDVSQYQDDLSGWRLQMALNEQQIDYNYTIITDPTDPDFVQLASSDAATMDLLLADITFSELTGTIEQQVLSDVKEMALLSDTRILTATIETGILAVTVNNDIGGEMEVELTIPELLDGGVELNTILQVEPGFQLFQLNIDGYNLEPPSLDEQFIHFETITTTSNDYGEYHLLESTMYSLSFPGIVFSEVTGDFSNTEIVEEDSISTDSEHIIEHAGVLTGTVTVELLNETGVPTEVEFVIEELTQAGEPLTRNYFIPADSVNYQREIVLDGYRLQMPADRQFIHYRSIMTLPSDEIITLVREDSLAGEVSIDTLYFADLTGTVSALTVESDTTTEELDLLPEELEGIRFHNVNMAVALETDIGSNQSDNLDILLSIGIRAVNPDGEEVLSQIDNWNILDSNRVEVPNATEMLNLLPDRFETWATAVIDGRAVINASEFLRADLEITLPFEFEILEDATIDLDRELLDEGIPEDLAEVSLMLEVDNQFSFGSRLTVMAAADTNRLINGTADTLLSLELNPHSEMLDTIRLADDKMELLIGDSTWIKARVDIIGLEDSNGDPLMTRILASDSMNIDLHSRFRFHLDLGEE